jgi:hypothetical protein
VAKIAHEAGPGVIGMASGAKAAERLTASSTSTPPHPLNEYFTTTAQRRLKDLLQRLDDRGIEATAAWSPTENQTARTTDLAAPLLRVIDEVLFDVVHDTEQYANNRVETDHGRLKARLGPMRGLKRDRTASVVTRGHAFIQNLRRGHYELGVNARNRHLRVAAAFDELAVVI